jgi:hypothetical protein
MRPGNSPARAELRSAPSRRGAHLWKPATYASHHHVVAGLLATRSLAGRCSG